MFESGCKTHRWDCHVLLEGKEHVENYGPGQPNLRLEDDYGEGLHGNHVQVQDGKGYLLVSMG